MEQYNKDRLHALAMRFYNEAEAPTQGAWSALFYFLLNRDYEGLRKHLEVYGIEVQK